MGYNRDVKCLFLYNPSSGRGKIARKLGYIEKTLKKRYSQVDIHATTSAEDLEEQARRASAEYDAIVFSGGDGTINHVLSAVEGSDVPLGYLPGGTANDVARSLGIPRSVRGALKVITRGRIAGLDCMRINGERYAMYIAAAGAFTSATYETPQSTKRALGWIAYAIHALRKNMKLDVFPMHITCGERTVSTHGVLMFILNGRSVSRFLMNRHASMQDGVLELAIIKQAEKPGFFRKIGAFISIASLMVLGVKVKKRDIEILRGSRVSVETDERVVWDFDGEKGTEGNVLVEVLPRRVAFFVPKKKKI